MYCLWSNRVNGRSLGLDIFHFNGQPFLLILLIAQRAPRTCSK